MLTFDGFRTTPVRTIKATYTGSSAHSGRPVNVGQNCDSADFSSSLLAEHANWAEQVSRVSQEIRTSTTTGDIQELRRAVAAGEYQPDPRAIAAKILMTTEA